MERMIVSPEREQCKSKIKIDFNATHNFLLLAMAVNDIKSVECVLISDGKLKEHFTIYYDNKGFHRLDFFYAREFMSEEKEITSNIVKGFIVILEVTEEQFFFTKSEGRHFDQIAEMLCRKFIVKE